MRLATTPIRWHSSRPPLREGLYFQPLNVLQNIQWLGRTKNRKGQLILMWDARHLCTNLSIPQRYQSRTFQKFYFQFRLRTAIIGITDGVIYLLYKLPGFPSNFDKAFDEQAIVFWCDRNSAPWFWPRRELFWKMAWLHDTDFEYASEREFCLGCLTWCVPNLT